MNEADRRAFEKWIRSDEAKQLLSLKWGDDLSGYRHVWLAALAHRDKQVAKKEQR